MAFEKTIRIRDAFIGKPAKKRSPIAMRYIKKTVQTDLHMKDVRVDPSVNEYVWSRGVRNTPRKIRVNIKVYEDQEKKTKFAYVSAVEVENFKGLGTVKVADEE